MNTSLKTCIARRAASIAAASMITFTGLQLICSYALPPQPNQAALTLASVGAATGAAPAALTR